MRNGTNANLINKTEFQSKNFNRFHFSLLNIIQMQKDKIIKGYLILKRIDNLNSAIDRLNSGNPITIGTYFLNDDDKKSFKFYFQNELKILEIRLEDL